jgi:hypothetical protein
MHRLDGRDHCLAILDCALYHRDFGGSGGACGRNDQSDGDEETDHGRASAR